MTPKFTTICMVELVLRLANRLFNKLEITAYVMTILAALDQFFCKKTSKAANG